MNLDRLAEIKARLEAGKFDCGIAGQIVNKYEASATVYCNDGKASEILRILMSAPSNLRDLITALEVAQESIADQDADIKRLEGALLSMNQAWQGIK